MARLGDMTLEQSVAGGVRSKIGAFAAGSLGSTVAARKHLPRVCSIGCFPVDSVR